MKVGKAVGPRRSLAELRIAAAAGLASLPEALRALNPESSLPVRIAPALAELTAAVDRRLGG